MDQAASGGEQIGMKLILNGEDREFSSISTLSDLVAQLEMKPDRVAVELNRELAPRNRWTATPLKDGDKLEIVHFVGGGCGKVTL
jgi:thiamine biosynthesis protein ThiS